MRLNQLTPGQYFSFTSKGLINKVLRVDSKSVTYCSHTSKPITRNFKNKDSNIDVFLRSPMF